MEQMDWSKINEVLEKQRIERADLLARKRVDLRKRLVDLGITHISATYDGYGDEGNVDNITLTPSDVCIDDVECCLMDFIWDIAYNAFPGFENNEGGFGELEWNLEANKISLDHATRYIECSHSTLEDL